MPKIYEYFGLIFFFYANEHLLIHVRVTSSEYESKLELFHENGKLKQIKAMSVKGRKPLPLKETKKATNFVKKYKEGIIDKWTTFFVKNQKVSCEIINEKI